MHSIDPDLDPGDCTDAADLDVLAQRAQQDADALAEQDADYSADSQPDPNTKEES